MTFKINDGSEGEQLLNYVKDTRNFDVDVITF
jgi:hypothetical protein